MISMRLVTRFASRVATRIGSTVTTPSNTGPSTVLMMNQRVRTRSTYSRRTTAISLFQDSPIAVHPRLHARCANALQEDLVQRWLDQHDLLHRRAAELRLHVAHRPVQHLLAVCDDADGIAHGFG